MINAGVICILQLLLHALVVSALPSVRISPPLSPTLGALWPNHQRNGTTFGNVTRLSAFPPGPPEPKFFYPITNTDLLLEFNPIGRHPGRNERLAIEIVLDAIHRSLSYRTDAKFPGPGYKELLGSCILGVTHYVGRRDLTWGMFTQVMTAVKAYLQAYPGYDFAFEVRLFREWGLENFIIAAGFLGTATDPER